MFILGPIIGAVRGNSVNIMYELDSTCVVQVTISCGDHVHEDHVIAHIGRPMVYTYTGVMLDMEYEVELMAASHVRRGRFRTFSHGTIEAMSCNNPHKGNEETLSIMTASRPSLCIHMGDQVYSDYGGTAFSSAIRKHTYDDMVHCFRNMYRESWSRDVMHDILSTRCNAMIMDDHDIVDSWDQLIQIPSTWESMVARGGWSLLASQYRSRKKKAIIAALQAYCEYQMALVGRDRPGSYTLEVGDRTILMVDVRMARATGSPLLDIDRHTTYDIVVCPIPVFMFPNIIMNRISARLLRILKIRDPSDMWNLYPEHRDQILDIISKRPTLLASGDSHMCGQSIIGSSTQMVSSGVSTPVAPRIVRWILRLAGRYSVRDHNVRHIHWTRRNNYMVIPWDMDPYFVLA